MVKHIFTDRTGEEGPKYSPEGIDVQVSDDYTTLAKGNVMHGPNASQELKGDFKSPVSDAIASPSVDWQLADNSKMSLGKDEPYTKTGLGTP